MINRNIYLSISANSAAFPIDILCSLYSSIAARSFHSRFNLCSFKSKAYKKSFDTSKCIFTLSIFLYPPKKHYSLKKIRKYQTCLFYSGRAHGPSPTSLFKGLASFWCSNQVCGHKEQRPEACFDFGKNPVAPANEMILDFSIIHSNWTFLQWKLEMIP